MSIYRAQLRNTSNALSPRVSSEQIRLQVPPKLQQVWNSNAQRTQLFSKTYNWVLSTEFMMIMMIALLKTPHITAWCYCDNRLKLWNRRLRGQEHSLEKAKKKMVEDWQAVYFTMTHYRDSGVSILASVDDILMLLEDQIVRIQTMRGFVVLCGLAPTAWVKKVAHP